MVVQPTDHRKAVDTTPAGRFDGTRESDAYGCVWVPGYWDGLGAGGGVGGGEGGAAVGQGDFQAGGVEVGGVGEAHRGAAGEVAVLEEDVGDGGVGQAGDGAAAAGVAGDVDDVDVVDGGGHARAGAVVARQLRLKSKTERTLVDLEVAVDDIFDGAAAGDVGFEADGGPVVGVDDDVADLNVADVPETSEPMATPPWPSAMWELSMIMSSQARLTRRPSASLPDLMEMQSSLTEMVVLLTRTRREESISMPSEEGMVWVGSRMLDCRPGNRCNRGCGGTRRPGSGGGDP